MKKNELQLMSEVGVSICIDGRPAGSVFCTPQNIEELAAGWLLTEGYISAREDIADIVCDPDDRGVFVSLSNKESGNKNDAPAGGHAEKESWSDDDLHQIFAAFKEDPPMRELTGASHSCMVVRHVSGSAVPSIEVLWRSEDAGRHSAFDKAAGWALLNGVDLGECLMMMSGRISTRMAMKAAQAGVSALAGKGTVTKEAVKIAEDNGMALIGYVSRDGAVWFNL